MTRNMLFHIGSKFYPKSGTIMSPIYERNTFKRWDWGKVQIALDKGEDVCIIQANEREMEWALNKLGQLTLKG